jgi:glycosyltransferase involved in cell wall biosynthesis
LNDGSIIDVFARLSLGLAVALCIGWGLVLVRTFRTIDAFQRLASSSSSSSLLPTEALPRVSVVIPARDEASGIEASLRTLLAQEGVDLEIIVVDDGSTDDTLAIVKRLAAEVGEKRLLVLEQKKLPPGWIAKNYAVETGQGRARGDWILFTDADVLHGPRAVLHAARIMEKDRLDHLAVFPRLEAGSLAEAVVMPLFGLLYQLRFVDPRAADPTSKHGTGIAGFNMVRADAYRLRGTHARIRGSILDDRALGVMMRDEGGRGSIVRAVGQVRVRPYRSAREMYFGIRKSVLAQFGNSAVLSAAAAVVLLVAAVAPPVLVLAGLPLWARGHAPWLVGPALLAILLPTLGLLKARTLIRFEPLAAVFFPVGAVVIAVSALHAATVFAVKGTVEWRGRTYTRKDFENS